MLVGTILKFAESTKTVPEALARLRLPEKLAEVFFTTNKTK